MREQPNAEKNSATALVPPIIPSAPWRVMEVRPLQGYRLHVRFVDGVEGIVDLETLIHSSHAGVFAALRDMSLFNQVDLVYGAVTWPGELDLAPDSMHDEIKANGEWVLR